MFLKDPEACLLVKRRAVAERRSAQSALILTIIEALSEKYASVPKSTQKPKCLQGESCEPVS